jgi:branched-chain amino acid transport system ATP-binding protein
VVDGEVLVLENVRSGYGASEVLHSVSMKAADGKITILIGPNGAGKTTLLKTIINLVHPTSGRIYIGNDEITGRSTREIIREGVSYVGQGSGIFPNMTVKENLRIGGYAARNRAELDRNTSGVLKLFPVLNERHSQKAGYLSGGERQMLAIARALVSSPKLLLLDEPSLGLDVGKQQIILDKMKELNETNGLTILLVEQNLRAAGIADICYVLTQGSVKYEGSPKVLGENNTVSRLFFGDTRKQSEDESGEPAVSEGS